MRADKLDNFSHQFSKVDLVKMDVEGAEVEALDGMKKIITRNEPIMIIEVLEKNESTVYDFMAQHGYRLVKKQNRNHLFEACKI